MPPPPTLRRCLAFSGPFRFTQIRHSSFTKQSIDKNVLVQLTKDVPKLGSRGDVVSVRSGRMRNMLYPYSMAQYIHPGAETFLTTNKLAIPMGPNYRRLLRKGEPDALSEEYRTLFQQVKARLSKEKHIGPGARDRVLIKLDKIRREVVRSKEWKPYEKKRLLRFLDMQLNCWGMLEDSSSKVRRAKESMLLRGWEQFTQDLLSKEKLASGKRVSAVTGKGKGEGGLEVSTAGTVVKGDVKPLKEGFETSVGTVEPPDQTVLRPNPHTVLVPQVGEVELSPFALWAQDAEAIEKSQAVEETPATEAKSKQTNNEKK